MDDELTRLGDGRFRTHNGEILISAKDSLKNFNRRQLRLSNGGAELPLDQAYFEAVRRAFRRSWVDEWGHWLCDIYANPVNGYRQIRVGGDVQLTKGLHVVSYTVFSGEITPGNHIDHVCRNRPCWCPEHLTQNTPQANAHDGVLARRHKVQAPLW